MEHRTAGALAADIGAAVKLADTHHHNDARKTNHPLAPTTAGFTPATPSSSSPFSSPASQPDDPSNPAHLIKRVQHDLAEALRLHSSPHVRQRLALLAAQRAWVEQVVRDALDALASVGATSGEQQQQQAAEEGRANDEGAKRRGEGDRDEAMSSWRQWTTTIAPSRRTPTTTMAAAKKMKMVKDGEGVLREQRVAALAACHASLLSAVAKMQRMEEEGVVGMGGEAGLASTAGKTAAGLMVVGGGSGCDDGMAGLPTYESSRNDERVVPWEYRPEGDAILRPSSTRKRFIKSRKDEKPRDVDEDLRGGPRQHTRAAALDEAFPYLQAFFRAIPEDTRVDTPAELPVELPAEVPLDRIPPAPQIHVANSGPGLLSPHPAFYTQSFDNSRDLQWDRASSKIPYDPAEITSNGSRLSASAMSKRRSFRKAKFGDTSQGVWETPDSIPNNISWAP